MIENYKKVAGIYKITSPSGRVYIGQAADLYKRFHHYRRGHCKRQPLLFNSFSKYGFDNHKFEVLYSNVQDLDNLEIKTIKEHKSNFNKYPDVRGLNLADGGPTNRGYKNKYSQDLRNKRRQQSLSEKGLAYFYAQNPEKLKGQKNPFYGKNHTIEAKTKMRTYRLGRKGSLNGKSKKVLNKTTGEIFESAYICSQQTGIHYSTLRAKLNGSRKNDTDFIYQNFN